MNGSLTLSRPGPGDLPPAAVGRVVDLVNRAYAVAEAGLWRDGTDRISPEEVAGFAARGELIVATARTHGIVGVVRLQRLSDEIAGFGMLVSDDDRRGLGIGSALLDEVERRARESGHAVLQLELLVPVGPARAQKVFLSDWYERRGFVRTGTTTIEEIHPGHGELLAVPCVVEVRQKRLG